MTKYYVTVEDYGLESVKPVSTASFGPYTERGALMIARQQLGTAHTAYPNYEVSEFVYGDRDPSMPLRKFKVNGWALDRFKSEVRAGTCRIVSIWDRKTIGRNNED